MPRIRIWQWPNLLALDAALIALAWQQTWALSSGFQLSPPTRLVLALSVWLTYTADHLFDVAQRPATQLQSARHRFAKQHFRGLVGLWGLLLVANLSIALRYLEALQLRQGGCLLLACLLYTGLSQFCSRSFFPKEICVAVIYACGTTALLPHAGAPLALASGSLALLCLINCLMISAKERPIDAALQVRSLNHVPRHWMRGLFLAAALPLIWLDAPLALGGACSLAALSVLQRREARLSIEAFRVLADAALLLGPAAVWLWRG